MGLNKSEKQIVENILKYLNVQKDILIEDTSEKGLKLSEINGFDKCLEIIKEIIKF